ncbi:MAG: VOC family protein, partial [Chloroflexi bacterium]
MKVVGLHHAGVVVANLERSIAFYGDVFGLEVAERLDVGGERLAFLQVGAARLELIESAPQAPRRTGLVDHVALEVRDLGGLLRHLEQRGVTLVDREPIDVPDLNARILFCLGPDGERIELFER